MLPGDFDFAHYNSAHPSLVAPSYLRGDEAVEIEGLHVKGVQRFRLPGHNVFLLLRYENGELHPVGISLDTVVMDVLEGVCCLVWRKTLPVEPALRVVEARMIPTKD